MVHSRVLSFCVSVCHLLDFYRANACLAVVSVSSFVKSLQGVSICEVMCHWSALESSAIDSGFQTREALLLALYRLISWLQGGNNMSDLRYHVKPDTGSYMRAANL